VDGDAGRWTLACAPRAGTAAMARLATSQSREASSPDVADVPTVPEQVLPTDRWRSAVQSLPQPALNTPNDKETQQEC
jgi:hypothetical protein